ncbi:uncharacterized protein Tco025E_04668 [Trypanosoma conorhini]|uniref:Uncharacterized protein n=1 Tax=Trypanosoma conorhini TaxID=83891 RepID=A0A3R7L806_9TRYP|nr:uncharacterized protein Tco025E_04668 [Trypanosoma conorhini]RNF18010.1 hypothetical protein Tco025E_04668 [Trypanosoma conorhini]
MTALAGGVAWQRALSQLQAKSWNAARAPTARHWLEFFYSCTSASTTRAAQNPTRLWTPPLPKSLRLFIAECLVDVVRLARLRQLLSPAPAGICCDARAAKEAAAGRQGGEGHEASASLCAAADASGVFLSAAAPSQLVELLSHCCAAHETPRDVEQVAGWLREAAALLRFFTPPAAAFHVAAQPPPRRRLYLTHAESLHALHHGLCTLLLRPLATGAGRAAVDDALDEEVALLAIWLLQKSRPEGADDAPVISSTPASSRSSVGGAGHRKCTGMGDALQETQMLLASRTATRAWLLQLPALLRDGCGNAHGGSGGGAVKKDSARFVAERQRGSFLCRLAGELLSSTLSAGSPNVCVPFVDRLALVDEAAVYAMHERLTAIAAGDGGG